MESDSEIDFVSAWVDHESYESCCFTDEETVFTTAIQKDKTCVFEDYFETCELHGNTLMEWLTEAINFKSVSVLKWLLLKADVKSCRKYFKQGSGSLMISALNGGDVNIVKLLIKAGAQRVNLNTEGDSDLHLAVRHHNHKLLKWLCTFRRIVNVTNNSGCSALFLAVMMNDTVAVRILVDAGAVPGRFSNVKPLKKCVDDDFAKFLKNGDTLLHTLIRAHAENFSTDGLCENILTILSGKFHKSVKGYKGQDTVFDLLIRSTLIAPRIYNKMLELKVPITMRDAFHHVVCLNDPEICLAILPLIEGDVNDLGGTSITPLVVACAQLNVVAVKWLLEHGAKPNFSVKAALSPQELRFLRESFSMVQWRSRATAMHVAAVKIGNVEENDSLLRILTLLIQSGADVNALNDCDATPLVLAVQMLEKNADDLTTESCSQAASVIWLLLQAGAKPEILSKNLSLRVIYTTLLEKITNPKLKQAVLMLLETSMSLFKTAGDPKLRKDIDTPEDLLKELSHLSNIVPESVIRRCIVEPRSLLELCRRSIRETYGDKLFFNTISNIPVPLQDFVRMKYISWCC